MDSFQKQNGKMERKLVFRIYETCKFLGKKASERLWSRRVGAGAVSLHSKFTLL